MCRFPGTPVAYKVGLFIFMRTYLTQREPPPLPQLWLPIVLDFMHHCLSATSDSNSFSMKVLLDCVDVDLLVDCQIWLATHPEAQNDFYNISNGDVFRFQQVRCLLIAQTTFILQYQDCAVYILYIMYI